MYLPSLRAVLPFLSLPFALLDTTPQEHLTAPSSVKDAKAAFTAAGLVPDVIPVFEPSVALEVVYALNDTVYKRVGLGTNFTKPETSNFPSFAVHAPGLIVSPGDEFVVAMIDPDAPKPEKPKNAEYRHFLGGGFALSHLPLPNVPTALYNTTPAMSEYIQPTPPSKSAPHRYVFLVFRQPPYVHLPGELSSEPGGFNITKWARKHGLGDPVGGNFFWLGTGKDKDVA